MYYFPPETQHVKSFFQDLAAGAPFRPQDLTTELRLDWEELTMDEKRQVRDATRQAAARIKALREEGSLQAARELANEAAFNVLKTVGERITPPPARSLPDDPRSLAALIRRR